ncbi:hypothetical protein EV03_1376 [Prochlorococcus marinus str. PAC1]|uniref:Uncharacterized protein n=1 Tax=Prochlorococcus marinus str. PAC1 TaxID=59924 RepID=A0A0A2C5L0_PROMR|nr:hypothetical protein EV03_1376 [Prochlorococcus marinus str. PAC1]
MKLFTPFSIPKAGMTALPKRKNKLHPKNRTRIIIDIQ